MEALIGLLLVLAAIPLVVLAASALSRRAVATPKVEPPPPPWLQEPTTPDWLKEATPMPSLGDTPPPPWAEAAPEPTVAMAPAVHEPEPEPAPEPEPEPEAPEPEPEPEAPEPEPEPEAPEPEPEPEPEAPEPELAPEPEPPTPVVAVAAASAAPTSTIVLPEVGVEGADADAVALTAFPDVLPADGPVTASERPWHRRPAVVIPLVLAVIAALLVARSGGGGDSDEDAVSTTTQATTFIAPESYPGMRPEDQIAGLDERIERGGLGLVLGNFRKTVAPVTGRRQPRPLVCFDTHYVNLATTGRSYESLDFKMQRPAGTVVAPLSPGLQNSVGAGSLPPEGSKDGTLCFPDDGKPGRFVFTWQPGAGTRRAVWLQNL